METGTGWTKMGFAGEEAPKSVVVSDVGYLQDDSCTHLGFPWPLSFPIILSHAC